MKIILDLKNLALYCGGIAHWVNDFLPVWIGSQSSATFIGLAPSGGIAKAVKVKQVFMEYLPWQNWVPRQLRHVIYDNWFFPRAIHRMRPSMIFSPYHDVLVPSKKSLIYSVITIHDLCFFEVSKAYPWVIGFYYRMMLKINLSRANHVLTVSDATRRKLINDFHVHEEKISIVPNALSPEFLEYQTSPAEIAKYREQLSFGKSKLLFYSGGLEYRKNIPRLLEALRLLWSDHIAVTLCITGSLNAQWKYLFSEEELAAGRVRFLGRLSMNEMRIAYEGVDAVVYPSLCEGFGRPCLEAMAAGTPLACSELPVFHEVAGNYANYFDPNNAQSIAAGILQALQEGKKNPRFDSRFEISSVQRQFVKVMSRLTEDARCLARRGNA